MGKGIQFKRAPPPAVYLNPLTYVLISMDFFFWLVTLIGPLKSLYNMFLRPAISAVVVKDPTEPDALIVRQKREKDKLGSSVGDAATPYVLIEKAFGEHKDRNAFGKRKYLGKEIQDVGGLRTSIYIALFD